MESANGKADVWSEWLLHKRHGNDPAYASSLNAEVLTYVDRLLDLACLQPEATLLDVGSGQGTVAFRAIERLGPGARVVVADISPVLLESARAMACTRQIDRQCRFIYGAAENLTEVGDASVDVVTTRAVLAYVADKSRALREFHRVLRPGGRISLAEPVFQYEAIVTAALRLMAEQRPGRSAGVLLQLIHRWKAAQYPDTARAIAESPLTNYSERTLWDLARDCGFSDMHMELHVDMRASPVKSWELFLQLSPHPLAPTLGELLQEQFSARERRLMEYALRHTIESETAVATTRIVYLSGRKAPQPLNSADDLGNWAIALDKDMRRTLRTHVAHCHDT